jgi:AcrR family transcriptional regulator
LKVQPLGKALILRVKKLDRSDEWNAKRNDVLLVAAKLFAEQGVDAVSMRDVAAASAVHVSTLYYYFPNKAEIYKAACHWSFDRISSAAMKALQSNGAPELRLQRLTESVVAFLMEDYVAARLLDYDFVFGHSMWDSSQYPLLTKDPTRVLADLLIEIDPPILRELKPERLAEMVWDVIYGIVKFSPAHVRLFPESHPTPTKEIVASESWVVIKRLIF